MNWKIVFSNLVFTALGLLLFDLLAPRGDWGQAGARIALLMAGALLGDPWKKPRTDAPRES